VEHAGVVRRIFSWFAGGKSPRWIAAKLNEEGVPSPGASWNRTSDRLNAKRTKGWVCTAIHGDRTRGTGILNNPLYIGQLRWNRSTWQRSNSDSKLRKWRLNDTSQVVTHQEELLRIVPQSLWDAAKARQQATEDATVRLRTAVKGRSGSLGRHVLSGLLKCQQCGGVFRRVNGRASTAARVTRTAAMQPARTVFVSAVISWSASCSMNWRARCSRGGRCATRATCPRARAKGRPRTRAGG